MYNPCRRYFKKSIISVLIELVSSRIKNKNNNNNCPHICQKFTKFVFEIWRIEAIVTNLLILFISKTCMLFLSTLLVIKLVHVL